MVRFGKRGKLSPRFIGPFEILKRVGTVAYRLALPSSMSGVHKVFHVSMLRRYTSNPAHVVNWGEIEVDTDGTFEEGPITPRPDEVHSTCNCKGAYVHQLPL